MADMFLHGFYITSNEDLLQAGIFKTGSMARVSIRRDIKLDGHVPN